MSSVVRSASQGRMQDIPADQLMVVVTNYIQDTIHMMCSALWRHEQFVDQPVDCCTFRFMEYIDKINETRYDYNMR